MAEATRRGLMGGTAAPPLHETGTTKRPRAMWLAALLLTAAAPPSAPPAIRLDQLGFEPAGPKIAILEDATPAPVGWRLVDPDGRVVASGATRVTGNDPASGAHLHRIDFGRFQAPGTYRLLAGGATSRPFPIRPGQWMPLARAAMGFFYQQRSGVPIEARFVARPDLARAAGHRPDRATCFSGRDQAGNDWPGCPLTLDVTGGWYDAGDQGKYVVNGGISTWTLLNAHERMARAGTNKAGPFADGRLALPERGNGVNDLLDEARWEVEFLLRMQVPDGTRLAVAANAGTPGVPLRFQEVDASGLVFQKVADEHWTPIPTAPADDRERRLLYPPTTAATLNLAAVAAQAARLWRGVDDAFAARCLAAARRAFAAAARHPALLASSSFTGSGGYGDNDVSDEFYWAAAELYTTTGDARFLAALRTSRHWPQNGADEPGFSWGATAMLGTLTLATVPTGLAPTELAAVRRVVTGAAERYRAATMDGFGPPLAGTHYGWGSNSDVLNHALVLGTAYDLTGDRADRDAAVAATDYLLGRNPLDVSFVTGFGANPMEHPHHRFWAHQADARRPMPPPGVLSGGPNGSEAHDPAHPELAGCAPQRCWEDDYRMFTVNEVAINWNAPLAWVASFLDTTEAARRRDGGV